jgi:hypothetical protein
MGFQKDNPCWLFTLFKMDNKTKQLLKIIKGKLYLGEPSLLFSFGKRCSGKGVIVEIGSYKGKSTMILARGSLFNSNSNVYAVDTFEGTCEGKNKQDTFKDFKKSMDLAGVSNLVIPQKGFSSDISKKFNHLIEILFIDGDHTYEGVIQDIDNWTPKLISNGWVLFHDTSIQGVLKAVTEKVISSMDYSHIGFMGSIIFAKKCPSSKMEKFYLVNFLMPLRNIFINSWKKIPESVKSKIRKKRNDGGF